MIKNSDFYLSDASRTKHDFSSIRGIMNEVNRKISHGDEYRDILDYVFDTLDISIPFDRIGVAIVDGEGDDARLSLQWVRSEAPCTNLHVAYSAPVKGSSLNKILETGKPRIIEDLISYLEENPTSNSTKLAIKDGVRSSLTCPLRSENKQIGVVFFSSFQKNTYKQLHINMFLEIANELSIIVDHGRLRSNYAIASAQVKNFDMTLHDLRSPLSLIKGFSEMSITQPWFAELEPEAKKFLDVIIRNSNYMFELIDDLIEVTVLGQSEQVQSVGTVELKEFCADVNSLGDSLTAVKEITFNSQVSDNLPLTAIFDKHKIIRVLDNLITNATKYSNRGSSIRFDIHLKADKLHMCIADKGLGIPADEFSKLFKEFGKTSVRPTEGEYSSGLGLAIAKKIILQHGGEIFAESEVGIGSTFQFWIPVEASHPSTSQTQH
jgi:signal transduction histidine kinase